MIQRKYATQDTGDFFRMNELRIYFCWPYCFLPRMVDMIFCWGAGLIQVGRKLGIPQILVGPMNGEISKFVWANLCAWKICARQQLHSCTEALLTFMTFMAQIGVNLGVLRIPLTYPTWHRMTIGEVLWMWHPVSRVAICCCGTVKLASGGPQSSNGLKLDPQRYTDIAIDLPNSHWLVDFFGGICLPIQQQVIMHWKNGTLMNRLFWEIQINYRWLCSRG